MCVSCKVANGFHHVGSKRGKIKRHVSVNRDDDMTLERFRLWWFPPLHFSVWKDRRCWAEHKLQRKGRYNSPADVSAETQSWVFPLNNWRLHKRWLLLLPHQSFTEQSNHHQRHSAQEMWPIVRNRPPAGVSHEKKTKKTASPLFDLLLKKQPWTSI